MGNTVCSPEKWIFFLGYFMLPCTRRVGGKEIATKQNIVGENEFAVPIAEFTGPCYHSVKSV